MINTYDINLSSLYIHWVGNKAHDEGFVLSKEKIELPEDINSTFLKYFLSSLNLNELYNFTNIADISLNEIYSFVNKIFEDPQNNLFEQSKMIAKYLYEISMHPNIHNGEVYIAYFENCEVNGIITDAIGIFKSENKVSFLEVNHTDHNFSVLKSRGINIDKLDKGCLIVNHCKEDGLLVCAVDNTNRGKEAKYWFNDFLGLKRVINDYSSTESFLALSKDFVVKQLPNEFEVTKADQADMLNRSLQYFKENEEFNIDGFTSEVIGEKEVIESFNTFKENYQQDREIDIQDNFAISDSAVKKQARKYKSVIKLDKNFHIYVHGSQQFIKRGFDEATGMYYYQLFFNEER